MCLLTRGYDCTEHIKDTVAAWKRHERQRIEERMQEVTEQDLGSGEQSVFREVMLYSEASDLLRASAFDIRDF